MRLVAILLALAAAAAAAAASGIIACEGCGSRAPVESAAALAAAGLWIAVAGLAYSSRLGAAQTIAATIVAGHAVLFVTDRARPCLPCAIALGAAVAAAATVMLASRRRLGEHSTGVPALALLAVIAGAAAGASVSNLAGRHFIAQADPSLTAAPVEILEWDVGLIFELGCPQCDAFARTELPRLREALGERLLVTWVFDERDRAAIDLVLDLGGFASIVDLADNRRLAARLVVGYRIGAYPGVVIRPFRQGGYPIDSLSGWPAAEEILRAVRR